MHSARAIATHRPKIIANADYWIVIQVPLTSSGQAAKTASNWNS